MRLSTHTFPDVVFIRTEDNLATMRQDLLIKQLNLVIFSDSDLAYNNRFPAASIIRYKRLYPDAFNMVPGNTKVSDLIAHIADHIAPAT